MRCELVSKCTFSCKSHRYLIKFLAKLSEYQDANKMTPGNMAIVLGPNLLWTHTEPYVFNYYTCHTFVT